jgi:hypothetical protein
LPVDPLPIRGNEVNPLQKRSILKKGKLKPTTEDTRKRLASIKSLRQRPQEGNDATCHRCQDLSSQGFHPEPLCREGTHNPPPPPQKGNETSMHHRRWRRNVELSLVKTFTDTRLVRPPSAVEVGLQNTVCELILQKCRKH